MDARGTVCIVLRVGTHTDRALCTSVSPHAYHGPSCLCVCFVYSLSVFCFSWFDWFAAVKWAEFGRLVAVPMCAYCIHGQLFYYYD